jgi:hypothetical protein
MSQLSIEIPDDLRKKAEAQAAERGHPSLARYVQALLEEAVEHDFGAPAHLRVESVEQLEALLAEGLASPATEMTSRDWDELRNRVKARAGAKAD